MGSVGLFICSAVFGEVWCADCACCFICIIIEVVCMSPFIYVYVFAIPVVV